MSRAMGLVLITTLCWGTGQMMAPLELSSGVVAGHILSKPAAPNLCSFSGHGAWTARVVIDESGKVAEAEMVHDREGSAVYLAWVRAFRYKPFEQDGRRIAVTSTLTVNLSCGG